MKGFISEARPETVLLFNFSSFGKYVVSQLISKMFQSPAHSVRMANQCNSGCSSQYPERERDRIDQWLEYLTQYQKTLDSCPSQAEPFTFHS